MAKLKVIKKRVTLAEFAVLAGVTAPTIQKWEKKGRIQPADRASVEAARRWVKTNVIADAPEVAK